VRGRPGLAAVALLAACSFHPGSAEIDAPGSDGGVPTGAIIEGSGG
jgi:hypothetical protein